MALSVSTFITAPHGIDEIGPVLAALRDQLGPSDRLIVLDGTRSGPTLDPKMLPNEAVFEHVRDAGESAFSLRCHLSAMADRDITILFEDHAVPAPHFMSEVRRLLADDPKITAVMIQGRNDTSSEPWGWANFLIAFAGCVHPAIEKPTTLIATSAAIRTTALTKFTRTLGAWETQFMPKLGHDLDRLAYSNEVWIDHVEHSSMNQSMIGNYHNQRAISAIRVANGHRRGKLAVRAFKDLGIRRPGQIGRMLASRDEYRHFLKNRWRIVLICWAATVGAIVGAWFGAGSSMREMH